MMVKITEACIFKLFLDNIGIPNMFILLIKLINQTITYYHKLQSFKSSINR